MVSPVCVCSDRSRWEGYNASAGTYDPRYRDYYDQNYWYNYNPEAYRGREAAYYNQQPSQQYPAATTRYSLIQP